MDGALPVQTVADSIRRVQLRVQDGVRRRLAQVPHPHLSRFKVRRVQLKFLQQNQTQRSFKNIAYFPDNKREEQGRMSVSETGFQPHARAGWVWWCTQ